MPQDLHILPKLRDSLSFLYVEHCILEQFNSSIIMITKTGKTPIPIAAMTVLLIGPGVSITHAAIKSICDCGCMAVWCGENGAKFYAMGTGETRSSQNLLIQAKYCMNAEDHLVIAKRMYIRRFPGINCRDMTIQQLRGLEGIRVRESYKVAAQNTGIKWNKRSYKKTNWDDADPVNRALSLANAILYSVCQAAIVSLGYSTGLGFIHTGKILSFVYDVADLYKAEMTIPVAFSSVKNCNGNLDREVRLECRQSFYTHHLLKRIPEDLAWIFNSSEFIDDISMITGALWDDKNGVIQGGINHADDLT